METSQSLDKLAPALAKAQSEMGGAVKDSNNPFFKSKYSSLTSVWQACKEALHSNGFSIIQSPIDKEGRIGVDTMVLHSSGQFVSGSFTSGVKKQNDPQADGSSLTYCRRYALAAFVGVCPVDDDGEMAMARNSKPQSRQITIGQDNVNWLMGFCKKHDILDAKTKKEFQDHYGFDPYKTTVEQFSIIKTSIELDYNEV